MNRILKNTALLTVVLLTATACTRRVQVESEPNRPSYLQTTSNAQTEIDIVGTYDYVVDMGANGRFTGPMTVARTDAGGYDVRVLHDGQTLPVSNVRRTGNALSMDVTTAGGAGYATLEWLNTSQVQGEVFLGQSLDFTATRRP